MHRQIFWTTLRFPSLQAHKPRRRQRLLNGRLINSLRQSFSRTAQVDAAGEITITPKQIYILPTRFGTGFALMIVAMLIGSNNYGINLGFMLTFLLSGMGLSAMIQTWRNLVHLEITPGHAEPVYCGEMAEFFVYVHNRRPDNRSALQLKVGENPVAFDLAGNQGLRVSCQIHTAKRGLLSPPRWTVCSYFPLGLFCSWAYFNTMTKCLVYPKPAADSSLDALFRRQIGDDRKNDDNLDFQGHRKYRPGDAPHRIDWKALARGRGCLVKHFAKNGDDNAVWLEWFDVMADDVEQKLSILCRAVIELSRFDSPFGLSLPGTRIAPDCGPEHKKTCLTALAIFK